MVLVGGSALLRGVQQQMQQLCPEAELYTENAMTAVADGLALASGSAFA